MYIATRAHPLSFTRYQTAIAVLAIVFTQMGPLARAWAQEIYPSRQIRLIVTSVPGASSDTVTRIVAAEAGKILGQPIVIESKPGGGSAIGSRFVKSEPADGYTLLYQTPAFISTLVAMKEPGYSLADFVPVALLAGVPYVLMVPASLKANTLSEFMQQARVAKPLLRYGSLGRGGRPDSLARRLAASGKFEWVEVPFKGAAQASLNMIGDNGINGMFVSQPFAVSQKDIAELKLLAISGDKRFDVLPDVPTFKEYGYPEMAAMSWFALFARSGTPSPVLSRIRAAFAQALKSPDVQNRLRDQGLSPYEGTIETFERGLKEELEETRNDLARIGISPE